MKIHPKAVKGDKNQVGAPMPGTVLSKLHFYYYFMKFDITNLSKFIMGRIYKLLNLKLKW